MLANNERDSTMEVLILVVAVIILAPIALVILAWLFGVRYIPHNKVGVIEKLWSSSGSLTEGRIVARQGEAGFQTKLLRGGLHFGLFPWQYRIHREPLVTIAEGKIGYVYARDGAPLSPMQTLGSVVECNSFQDAHAFLNNGGQRGRQRAILREGVYAINQSLFVVIAEDWVYTGPMRDKEDKTYQDWQAQLHSLRGFDPVVIGSAATSATPERDTLSLLGPTDTLGIVTVHDGAPIAHGEIIAPEIEAMESGLDHHYFQDPEAFLTMGGKRGKQLQVLTDGTFFINRWFATVEIKAKTLIPIGFVGVVVSYYGNKGSDLTGTAFRYGEQVESGSRGVWRGALPPGKFALNPYALKVEPVPTVNFVLRWITGQVEAHHYDEDLTSIDLITADGYEPRLPLSLVLHIDYQKAPSVVQRFGDVKRLITQTLDPILTAYFRDVAQTSHMLDLLTKREEIQRHATEELGARFQKYDINVVAVLIGRPESREIAAGQADPIETLFDQLRMRRLADEQRATYAKQEEAAQQQVALNQAKAKAERQTELTQSAIAVEIAKNRGQAQFAEAEQLAKKQVTLAEGEARAKELIGKGESSRIAQVGLAEAAVTLQKVSAFRDPRLYALNVFADQFSQSVQPLVPSRLFISNAGGAGGNGEGAGTGSVLETLLSLILSEKAGINVSENTATSKPLEEFIQQFTGRTSPNGNPTRKAAPAAEAEVRRDK